MKLSKLFMKLAKEMENNHFFGIPGSGVPLDLMDNGKDLGVKFINVAHESSAAISAGTYGLIKGSAGVALAVKGVGAANLGGGIALNDNDNSGWILHTSETGQKLHLLSGAVGAGSTDRVTLDGSGLQLLKSTEQFNSVIRTGSTNSGDFIGNLAYKANDSAGNLTEYVKLLAQIVDNTNGSEDSRYQIETFRNGSLTQTVKAESGYFLTPSNPGIYLDALDWSQSNTYMHNGFEFWQIGNHWNNTTGTFTCPVAGKYLVAADAQGHRTADQTGASQQYANLVPQVNNFNVGLESVVTTRQGGTTFGSLAPHQSFGFSIILKVEANDTIRVNSNHGFRTNTQNHLTIYLLG